MLTMQVQKNLQRMLGEVVKVCPPDMDTDITDKRSNSSDQGQGEHQTVQGQVVGGSIPAQQENPLHAAHLPASRTYWSPGWFATGQHRVSIISYSNV
jgi:hypothetical protein